MLHGREFTNPKKREKNYKLSKPSFKNLIQNVLGHRKITEILKKKTGKVKQMNDQSNYKTEAGQEIDFTKKRYPHKC